MEKRILTALLTLFVALPHAVAQSDDFGMWYSVGAEKKLSTKWSVGAEGEFRTRNNSKTVSRFSLGVSGDYKLTKWLKASAAYTLLDDNNQEDVSYKADGVTFNKWTPSYYGLRHRFTLALTGSVKLLQQRLKLSLREQWQYTYRPSVDGKKYDIDNDEWDPVKAKHKHILRSRLQAEYNIPHWKFDPFASAEMFNGKGGVQKMRYTVGVSYTYNKKHDFALAYRYQWLNDDDDDNEANSHIVDLSYKFKF